jgi:hypothetical protein
MSGAPERQLSGVSLLWRGRQVVQERAPGSGAVRRWMPAHSPRPLDGELSALFAISGHQGQELGLPV